MLCNVILLLYHMLHQRHLLPTSPFQCLSIPLDQVKFAFQWHWLGSFTFTSFHITLYFYFMVILLLSVSIYSVSRCELRLNEALHLKGEWSALRRPPRVSSTRRIPPPHNRIAFWHFGHIGPWLLLASCLFHTLIITSFKQKVTVLCKWYFKLIDWHLCYLTYARYLTKHA